MERFIAFDVETPNSYNHRMSSIVIAVIEQGRIVDSYSSLIDPETHFDAFNIALTGVSPEIVKNAPTFPELWVEIGETMLSGILVAHNAAFDMRVLSRCLMNFLSRPQFIAYRIGFRPLAVRFSEALGAMRFGWTARNERAERHRDSLRTHLRCKFASAKSKIWTLTSVTDVTGVAIRISENGFPRQCEHWLGMTG